MRNAGAWLLLAPMLWALARPAHAEIGVGMTVLSDYRFRGYSLSQGRPVTSLNLSYDDARGVYVNGELSAVATKDDGIELLGVTGNAGYARKLSFGPTFDIGVIRSRYTRHLGYRNGADYTEIYAGLIARHISAHLHYSPGYFRDGVSTIYADMNAVARPLPDWRINGHYGLLTQIGGSRPPTVDRIHHDWRLSVARETGALDLQIALTGGAPGKQFYRGRFHSRKAVAVFSATYLF